MEVSPELVALGAYTVGGIFDFADGGVDFVVDYRFARVYAFPALDDGA